MKTYLTKQKRMIEDMRNTILVLDEENAYLRHQLDLINGEEHLKKIEEMNQMISDCKEAYEDYCNSKRKYNELLKEMISLKNEYIKQIKKIL